MWLKLSTIVTFVYISSDPQLTTKKAINNPIHDTPGSVQSHDVCVIKLCGVCCKWNTVVCVSAFNELILITCFY